VGGVKVVLEVVADFKVDEANFQTLHLCVDGSLGINGAS
jgi:hypothetical protein